MAETLTEQRIRERDEQQQAFDSAAAPTSQFSRYRRSGNPVAEQALDLQKQKFEYQQGKDAFDQAAKTRALEMRADADANKAVAADTRATIAEKMAELAAKNSDIAERAAQLRIDQQLAKTNATDRALAAGETYFKEAAALDPYAPDFTEKFTDLKRRTLAGAENDDVKKHTDYLLKEREKSDAYNMSFAPKPDKEAKDTENVDAQRRLSNLEKLRSKFTTDQADPTNGEFRDVVGYLDRDITALRGKLAPESTPASPVPAAILAAPTFAPGATATKNGVTYIRGEDGKWLPQP